MFLPVSARQLPSQSSMDFPGGSIAVMFSRVMMVKFCDAGSSFTACSRSTFVRYWRSARETLSFTSGSATVSRTATNAACDDTASASKRQMLMLKTLMLE